MSECDKDLNRYAKYKWEFLRRSADYIRDWQNLQKDWENFNKNSNFANKIYEAICQKEIDVCEKWDIEEGPIDPSNTYEDLLSEAKKLESLEEDAELLVFQKLLPGYLSKKPVRVIGEYYNNSEGLFSEFFQKRALFKNKKPGKIKVEIDLSYSKNRIINDFEASLDLWKHNFKMLQKIELYYAFLKRKGINENEPNMIKIMESDEFNEFYKEQIKRDAKNFKKKYHFENFDLYLQVYDLREDENKSWTEIAGILGLNNIQAARNHYNKAKELIENGIELYVK